MTLEDVYSTHTDPHRDGHGLISAPCTVEPGRRKPIVGPHGGPLRVLVVGINYGPEHTGIAPYTTQLCEYLAARDASISVLTGVPHYPSWTVEPKYRWRVRRTESRNGVNVRRLRHYVPRTQSAVRRGLYELTFALQAAIQRPQERPDVVLAVVPSLLGAAAAHRIAKRAGAPLVVWVQDLMGQAAEQSGMKGGDRVAGVVASIERQVLRRADQVLVLNSHFANYVESVGIDRNRLLVRPNWTHVPSPSSTGRDQARARLGWRSDETIVLHTGNMGLKQDLGNVVDAARQADERRDTNVRFVLMGDGSQRRELQQAAAGITSIEFLPPARDEEYANVLAAADILLVNERASSIDMSLPSKLTSYFRAGRPVVAACPAEGGTAAEVRRSGGGLALEPGQPLKLLQTVQTLAADRDLMTLMGKRGCKYADDRLDARQALSAILHSMMSLLAA